MLRAVVEKQSRAEVLVTWLDCNHHRTADRPKAFHILFRENPLFTWKYAYLKERDLKWLPCNTCNCNAYMPINMPCHIQYPAENFHLYFYSFLNGKWWCIKITARCNLYRAVPCHATSIVHFLGDFICCLCANGEIDLHLTFAMSSNRTKGLCSKKTWVLQKCLAHG